MPRIRMNSRRCCGRKRRALAMTVNGGTPSLLSWRGDPVEGRPATQTGSLRGAQRRGNLRGGGTPA